MAFDDNGEPSTSWLYPLTAAQQQAYLRVPPSQPGLSPILSTVSDTPAARGPGPQIHHTHAERATGLFREMRSAPWDTSSTASHCAGIALRGNPAARLVVARFNDDLPDYKFPPTDAWVMKMGADFPGGRSSSPGTRHVRVVNMSWGDTQAEFENWINKTGGGGDPILRKANASRLFHLWKESIQDRRSRRRPRCSLHCGRRQFRL